MPKDKLNKKSSKSQHKRKYDISYTQNRELSWLKFNERVLEEADDKNVPLYERLKFVSIFTSNLDEFFMVRVGSIHDLSLIKQQHIDNKTGQIPEKQLENIFSAVKPLYKKRDNVYFKIEEQMRKQNIHCLTYSQLSRKEKEYTTKYYNNYIKPILSPQIVDSHHPFPHLVNNELYVCLSLKQTEKNNETLLGILPIPTIVPRVIYIPSSAGEVRYIMTYEVALKFADKEFTMQETTSKNLIKVTRNADINLEDEQYDVDDDFRQHMKKLIKKRGRLKPVRLEFLNAPSKEISNYLLKMLSLKKEQTYVSQSPLCMKYVFSMGEKLPKSTLKTLSYQPFAPQEPKKISKNSSMLKQVSRRDILLFYPYEKMEPFLRLIKEASEDRNVVSIKITIYRLANKSKLVEYLINAVENNKEVMVLMELRARFDEENNINWSQELEEAGCQIIYGFDDYKVHSKICLITRKEKGKIQYITQIGTGNYNEKTAKMYTDLSFITSNQNIGKDAATFFQNMSTANLKGEYKHLLVSPTGLKEGIIKEIDKEIEKGEKGKIFMKMNSLTDREIIDKLQQASMAGVQIVLNVRGICCIKPKITNKTENIKVISIVGRFLEHPRIYCFGNNLDELRVYIGSADMMTRNTQRRVEILTPIESKEIKKEILYILGIIGHDTVKARKLKSDGTYEKMHSKTDVEIDSQEYFMNLYKSYSKLPQSENMTYKVKQIIKTFKDKIKR